MLPVLMGTKAGFAHLLSPARTAAEVVHWAERKHKASMPYVDLGIPKNFSRLNLAEHRGVRELLGLHVWVEQPNSSWSCCWAATGPLFGWVTLSCARHTPCRRRRPRACWRMTSSGCRALSPARSSGSFSVNFPKLRTACWTLLDNIQEPVPTCAVYKDRVRYWALARPCCPARPSMHI